MSNNIFNKLINSKLVRAGAIIVTLNHGSNFLRNTNNLYLLGWIVLTAVILIPIIFKSLAHVQVALGFFILALAHGSNLLINVSNTNEPYVIYLLLFSLLMLVVMDVFHQIRTSKKLKTKNKNGKRS